ncbi:MAG: sensor of ECF-type sigma factor [Bacteroidia bacterium]
MKKIIAVLTFMLAMQSLVWAQRGGPNKEKIDALKVGFITKKLDLSSEEAQKFWPVYNKYHDELEKNRESMRSLLMEHAGNLDKLSQAEADKVLQEMQSLKIQELEIAKQYLQEFKKVLPSQKVIKLFMAEHEFKRELLRQLKGQRGR